MPGTRMMRLCGRRARKEVSGRLSCRQRSSSRSRPRFQEVIIAIIAAPSTSGTQPPSGTFSALAEKNSTSTARKPPKTATAAARDQWNWRRNTTIASTQVQMKVPVTAMP
jgi:hypothetical protein